MYIPSACIVVVPLCSLTHNISAEVLDVQDNFQLSTITTDNDMQRQEHAQTGAVHTGLCRSLALMVDCLTNAIVFTG